MQRLRSCLVPGQHWPLPSLEPDKRLNRALLCRQVWERRKGSLVLILFPSRGWPGEAAAGEASLCLLELHAPSSAIHRPLHRFHFLLLQIGSGQETGCSAALA